MERTITYFDKPGAENTSAVLALVKRRAAEAGVQRVVVASTTGDTARQAAEALGEAGLKLIVIPHQHGFGDQSRFDPHIAEQLEKAGHRVHWATMLFHTEEFYGTNAPTALANVLRTFGQGTKVCIEILLMAADAGLVSRGERSIVVAGSGRGADTAILATASTSNRLREVRVHEILCKPGLY